MKTISRRFAQVFAAAMVCSAWLPCSASAGSQAVNHSVESWRAAIARTPVPAKGCFTASYPVLIWRQISCVTAPKSELAQLSGMGPGSGPVTGGDYAAVSKKLISAARGSFPVVKHLKSEQGPSGKNDYTLQLNSNYMPNDPACAGEGVAGACRAWQQFVFVNLYGNAFIQYWLVFYNAPCPTGWNPGPLNSCWINSALVPVPQQAITELPYMNIQGYAAKNGVDTVVLTTRTQAYSTGGNDDMLYLANGWHAADFNVLGTGSGEAVFNAGASLTDRVELVNNSTRKPKCEAYAGHSSETNNLVPGACRASGGSIPGIQFVEKAPSN